VEIVVDRDDWVHALQTVSGIVDRKHTLPILANVLVDPLGDGQLRLTASDREMEMSCELHCDVKSQDTGQVTLPTKKCLDICRSFGEGTQLRIKVDDNRATIFANRSRFTLSTLPPDEFPVFRGGDLQCSFNVPGETLKTLINRTSFAMAQQDVRFYLNGLLLDVRGGALTFVGADGHRMAVSHSSIPGLIDVSDQQVIIPRKAIQEIQKLVTSGLDVTISLSRNFVKVSSDNIVFFTRLVDSKFPDYQRIIPNTVETEFTVNRQSLKSALSRIAIISSDKYKGARFILESGFLRLRANNPEQEEALEELEIDYSGGLVEIGFNTNYILDVLGALPDEEEVRFLLASGNNSALVQGANDDHAKYVVMPIF